MIRVYIDSPRLMNKQSIYDLEKGIKEQLFPGKRVKIKILEKYHLSLSFLPFHLRLCTHQKYICVYQEDIITFIDTLQSIFFIIIELYL